MTEIVGKDAPKAPGSAFKDFIKRRASTAAAGTGSSSRDSRTHSSTSERQARAVADADSCGDSHSPGCGSNMTSEAGASRDNAGFVRAEVKELKKALAKAQLENRRQQAALKRAERDAQRRTLIAASTGTYSGMQSAMIDPGAAALDIASALPSLSLPGLPTAGELFDYKVVSWLSRSGAVKRECIPRRRPSLTLQQLTAHIDVHVSQERAKDKEETRERDRGVSRRSPKRASLAPPAPELEPEKEPEKEPEPENEPEPEPVCEDGGDDGSGSDGCRGSDSDSDSGESEASGDSAFGKAGVKLSLLVKKEDLLVLQRHAPQLLPQKKGNDQVGRVESGGNSRGSGDQARVSGSEHGFSDSDCSGSDSDSGGGSGSGSYGSSDDYSDRDYSDEDEEEAAETFHDGVMIQRKSGSGDEAMVMSSDLYVTVLQDMLELRAALMMHGIQGRTWG